jgi:Sec7-like guanine-nucleotide exchange factor
MVECIAGLTARIPTFMIDLFINYDCEVDLSDLCEDVVGFLARNAFPDAAGWSTSNVPPICLNALWHISATLRIDSMFPMYIRIVFRLILGRTQLV